MNGGIKGTGGYETKPTRSFDWLLSPNQITCIQSTVMERDGPHGPHCHSMAHRE